MNEIVVLALKYVLSHITHSRTHIAQSGAAAAAAIASILRGLNAKFSCPLFNIYIQCIIRTH